MARAVKPPRYEATLYFRLTEGDLADTGEAGRPPRDIRQYIANVALSREQLERIMTKFGRSSAWLARDRQAAIDAFREDIEIAVERNYFIYERGPGDAPRSAQVTISLSGSDEDQTRGLLREIGEAIIADQAAQRAGRLAAAREHLNAQLARARARTTALRDTAARLALEAARTTSSRAFGLRARIAGLAAEIKAAADRELALERRASAVAFSEAAEEEQLGMKLELVDESVAAFAIPLTPIQHALRAALLLPIVLLLVAVVVGAFDDRVYTLLDLENWGIPRFGALPRFPGDDAGALRARNSAGVG